MVEGPLAGRRVVLTRPRAQAGPLADALERLGATVVVVPLIAIEPVADLEKLIASTVDVEPPDWLVVTSANAAAALGGWSGLASLAASSRVAAVGPATATALRSLGLDVDLVPERYGADELAALLAAVGRARVLLVQSDIADPRLAAALREQGAHVDEVHPFHTVEVEPPPAEASALEDADVVVLASGSAARSLASLARSSSRLRRTIENALVVCIGPRTAEAARDAGLAVGLVAEKASAEGIIHALTFHYAEIQG